MVFNFKVDMRTRSGMKYLLLATAVLSFGSLQSRAQTAPSPDATTGAILPPMAVVQPSLPAETSGVPAVNSGSASGAPSTTGINPNMPGQQASGTQELGGKVSGNTDQQWDANSLAKLEESLNQHLSVNPQPVKPQDLRTLFFTPWQYALLNEAKQSFKTRPPTKGEIANAGAPKPAGPREISLGGISFINHKDWTVWLNSQRIKPDAIPSEVIDLKVSSDHIDLKWFDNANNLVYPIRLHPHERFNLDQRIFLPGAGI